MHALKTASPPAVDRALTILELLAQSTRGLRLPEIALRLGVPKSSAHSLLVALERRGYLQRCDHSGRYRFGLKILSLANVAMCGMTLRDVAYPVLTGLMRSTGLAAKLAILDRDQAVLIEQVHPQVSTPMTWLGKRLDLHCTALGKVLAAFQPQAQWSRMITEHRLPRHNANTICSPRNFLKELTLTRERGYALDNEEFDLGMRCLAVPIFANTDGTVAAIGITGTTSEIHEGNLESLLKTVTTAAANIGASLAPVAEQAPTKLSRSEP